ncbi:FAS1-like dehydratase domain-containing protein [Pontibacillus yanchengensis]|uniref:FAS1-like dehydratase domain-containing protein n=1 Tax=Pontibacillus yanchengensis Y32 TaxID=1385514 RepID=A0A0A2TAC9_9BACI|nr:MaoC family dehydratase N-terminal domain-containing protein [Pontibacillus yanchengensis]KGP72782.1 hypothetical protein N782_10500 [Pontibacillus yanchengensis Y32]
MDASFIGSTTEVHLICISPQEIKEYAEAIFLQNPIYVDRSKAVEAGFEDIPVPPTMPIVFWQSIHIPWISDFDGFVHTNQSFQYDQCLFANKTYECVVELTNVVEKIRHNKSMTFMEHKLLIYHQGELCGTAFTTFMTVEEE